MARFRPQILVNDSQRSARSHDRFLLFSTSGRILNYVLCRWRKSSNDCEKTVNKKCKKRTGNRMRNQIPRGCSIESPRFGESWNSKGLETTQVNQRSLFLFEQSANRNKIFIQKLRKLSEFGVCSIFCKKQWTRRKTNIFDAGAQNPCGAQTRT